MAVPAIPDAGKPWLTWAQGVDAEARKVADKVSVADIADPNSTGGAALRAAFRAEIADATGGAVPAWAGVRTGKYDAARHLYLPAGITLGSAKAKIGAASTSRVPICAVGDSTVAGFGAVRSTTSWPSQLASDLATAGIPRGGSGVALSGGYNPPDTRWSLAGGFALSMASPTSTTDGFMSAAATTTGATATFASVTTGTSVDIWYQENVGTWTYSIDGATPVAVPAGSATVNKVITVTGLANTAHTVTITTTSSGKVVIVGAEVYASTGLSVTDLGMGSTTSGFWTGSLWYNAINFAKALAPKISFVCLGINDRNNVVPTATFKTNLTAVVTALKASGDVILLIPNRINVSATSQSAITEDPYLFAIYDVADALGCPLFDSADLLGTFAQANSSGLMFDTYHPNATGYGQIASMVFNGIKPAGGTGNTLYAALASAPETIIAGTITRDVNGAATSAPVIWPDGTPGQYIATTTSTAFAGAVDAYYVTYGSPTTETFTQPTVTRDTNGAVTQRPAMVMS